MYIKITADKN